jgi:methyl-accepting chemotaxis protein
MNLLIGMLLGAVVVVALVGILTTYLISARTTHMARLTSPLQLDLARLMGDVERAAKEITLISVTASESELAVIKGQCQETIADAGRAVAELSELHAGIDRQTITQLTQAFEQVSAMAAARLAADATIRAAHLQVDHSIEAVLAIHGRLAESRGAIAAISDIGTVIGTISQIQTSIAGAVEEQTATTREMTGNLNLAAQGCREIARNILVVSQTASGTAGNAEHVRQFAEQLAAMAGELDRLCAQQHAATACS